MRLFLVLCVVGVALARPEAGYNYRPPPQLQQQPSNLPSGSYGAPFQGGFNGGFSQSSSSNQFVSSGHGGHSHNHGGGFESSSSISTGFGGGNNGGFHGGSNGGFVGSNSFIGGGSGSGFTSSGGSNGFVSQGNLAPIIQKHIYVHVPPPEPVEEQQRFQQQILAPRKNYKIIFIKAPTAPAVSPAIIAQQQQNQEKTIVYVLVKKPDEQETLTLSGLPPSKPSKPEVYFIKYKTQKDVAGSGANNNFVLNGSGSSQISSGSSSSISGSSSDHLNANYGPPGASGPY